MKATHSISLIFGSALFATLIGGCTVDLSSFPFLGGDKPQENTKVPDKIPEATLPEQGAEQENAPTQSIDREPTFEEAYTVYTEVYTILGISSEFRTIDKINEDEKSNFLENLRSICKFAQEESYSKFLYKEAEKPNLKIASKVTVISSMRFCGGPRFFDWTLDSQGNQSINRGVNGNQIEFVNPNGPVFDTSNVGLPY
jgi:hypothetical protein